MRASRLVESTTRATLDTDPTGTPRNVTGAPTTSPPTDPSKNTTALVLGENTWPPPKKRMPATTIARPPRTNAPTAAGLAEDIRTLPVSSRPRRQAVHKRLHGGVRTRIAQVARRAMRDGRPGRRIQEHAV